MALVSKTYCRILAVVLAWVGYSCDNNGCEYGTPAATYKAKGTVVSKEDGKPIKGIRAVMIEKTQSEYGGGLRLLGIDTTYTDINGKFNLVVDQTSMDNFQLRLEDVDGEENGSFVNQIEKLDYSGEKFTGGKGWYKGEAEKDLGNIEMTSKE